MTNLLINGEIYIQKNPTRIKNTKLLIKELKKIRNIMATYRDIGDDDLFESLKSQILVIEDYLNQPNGIDYQDCSSFKTLSIRENNYVLNSLSIQPNTIYDDPHKLLEENMSLLEFISKASFIGQRFQRLPKTEKKYISDNLTELPMALYELEDETTHQLLCCQKNSSSLKDYYLFFLVERNFLDDQQYHFIGSKHPELDDKRGTYFALHNQILDEYTFDSHDDYGIKF